MIDYDKSLGTARDGSPFSNGTEGYAWLDNWCGTCINDKPARQDDPGNGCPLILIALSHKTPAEWVDQWDRAKPFPLGDNYRCTMFRSEGDGPDPEPRPIADPPGQLVLVPRAPFEQARMLVPTEAHAAVTP